MLRITRLFAHAIGQNKKVLSIDEALYLAKDAGFATKAEIQKLIVASPPFSPDKSPFLISNFFNEKRGCQTFDEDIEEAKDQSTQIDRIISSQQLPEISQIDHILAEKTNPGSTNFFWNQGERWKVRADGFGTCMRSTTHLIIQRGRGIVKVNGEEDLYKRWPIFYNRMDVLEPLYLAGCCGVYDVFIETRGGGITGQSRSARLALARALVSANPSVKYALEAALYEDTRQKMPKMPGRTGARSLRKWRKR
ncbi:Ribosomal protein S16, putative [Babesia bigemina]|uniref:Ribosomal protein S16, putative n=1 Tax=Babesia bigemina TaxID=5866 RepID=A0A061DDJ9_BABBI|nr:Ribosomal protein S16, putative [Babesia bigemina]CDR96310.1 Ribosomal protein S16, putative [Babesia bigemina]|eukprot:XP_012768496.1 Ribosomal protein S16, putative [Babesia bigemina]